MRPQGLWHAQSVMLEQYPRQWVRHCAPSATLDHFLHLLGIHMFIVSGGEDKRGRQYLSE
jgi:hypothetical protein